MNDQDFNWQQYLEGMDRRLMAGINLANHRIQQVSDKLVYMDKRLVRNETQVKWIGRIFVPTFLGITGWGFWALAHAVFAAPK
jgi:hypothetical protein